MNANIPRRRDEDLIECDECGATFDVNAVWYYGPKCPACLDDAGDEERTWPGCIVCGERIPPDERATKVVGGSWGTPRERVPVHAGCK